MSPFKKNKLTVSGKQLTKQQWLFTTLITFFCTVITYFFWGFIAAKSALIGGLIVIIPNIIFGYKAFKYAGASKAQQVVDSFFLGEKLKILLTVVLFAFTFKFLLIQPIPLFSVFSLVMLMSLLTPVFFNFNHWKK